jgi:hypothetical protein
MIMFVIFVMCMCSTLTISKTGQTFETRYKKHIRHIKNNNSQSAYAEHILSNIYDYSTIESTMTLLQTAQKGKSINTLGN